MASSESKFLFITFTLAILLGVPTFYSVFEPTTESSLVKATLQIESRNATRGPASVKKAEVSTLLKKDIFCDPKAKAPGFGKGRSQFRTKNDFIQLSGKTCLKKTDLILLNVVNKTNGYTASFFNLEDKKYQTDLIRLQSGKNLIEFEVVGPGNQREVNSIEVNADLSVPAEPADTAL